MCGRMIENKFQYIMAKFVVCLCSHVDCIFIILKPCATDDSISGKTGREGHVVGTPFRPFEVYLLTILFSILMPAARVCEARLKTISLDFA